MLQARQWQLKNVIRWNVDDILAYWHQGTGSSRSPSFGDRPVVAPSAPATSLTPLIGLPMDQIGDQIHWAVLGALHKRERVLFRCMDIWTQIEVDRGGKRKAQRPKQYVGEGIVGTTDRLIIVRRRWSKIDGTGYAYGLIDRAQQIGIVNSFWRGTTFQFTATRGGEAEVVRVRVHKASVTKFSFVGHRIHEYLEQKSP